MCRATMVTVPAAPVRTRKRPALSVTVASSDSSRKTLAPAIGTPLSGRNGPAEGVGRLAGGAEPRGRDGQPSDQAEMRGFHGSAYEARRAFSYNYSANRLSGSVSGQNAELDRRSGDFIQYSRLSGWATARVGLDECLSSATVK